MTITKQSDTVTFYRDDAGEQLSAAARRISRDVAEQLVGPNYMTFAEKTLAECPVKAVRIPTVFDVEPKVIGGPHHALDTNCL